MNCQLFEKLLLTTTSIAGPSMTVSFDVIALLGGFKDGRVRLTQRKPFPVFPNRSYTKGPSIYDVRKILGFFDPPLSAFGTDLQH